MSESKFFLPDVGEGLNEAEIVDWKVKPGDPVEVNQILVEIETAKSLVELPSPFGGTVGAILVEAGTTVDVGTPIITIASDGDAQMTAPAATLAQAALPPPTEAHVTMADEIAGSDEDGAGGTSANLVGYGSVAHVPTRRRAGGPPTLAGSARRAARGITPRANESVVAKPPIRKLAKDLGVDLRSVTATGWAGEITRDDVIGHAKQASVFRNIRTPEWPSDREERVPVKGVRKAIAQAMVSSAFDAPHVSLFVDVDATRTMEFVARLKTSPDFAGIRVSPLLIVAKALVWAVRRNPTVNSSWTDAEVIVHHYVNLGIAAATPRGLLVPNVKDAQTMSLLDLASALEELTSAARDGKTAREAMSGGTITITNIGVFGMDTGTPILNPGEAAILALGTIKHKPWVVDGEVRPRYVTTIGASFDHRVVDGDVASRFVADVASIVEEPALLLD